MIDPKETRMVQTRDGVARIPRTEPGVPLKDYLRNTELPENLENAVIHSTPTGPVAVEPDPVPWTEAHDAKVREYADAVRDLINEKGYYAKSLSNFAGRLSSETGYPEAEMKAMIVSAFNEANGHDPFDYLQAVRASNGLPVRERQSEQRHDQEMGG